MTNIPSTGLGTKKEWSPSSFRPIEENNQQLSSFRPINQEVTIPDQNASFKEKVAYLQTLPEEERKKQLGSGELIFQQSRNLGKEKSKALGVIEGIGGALGFAGQVAAEALGKTIGGKKGSALAAGSATTLRGVARESWQNITGYQDEPPAEAVKDVFIDAGSSAAIDLALNVAFDDVIPTVKKQVLKVPFISKLVGKGRAAQEVLAAETLAKAGKSWDALNKQVGNVKKFFLDSGMGEIRWWENAKNDFGKMDPFGVIVNRSRIADFSQQLEPILKEYGDNGIKFTYDDAKELLEKDGKKTIIRNIQNTDLPESEIKNAIADGGEIIDDVFKMIKDKGLNPTEVKKIATELFDGTFTSTGKASVAKSKTAQREVAFMLTHWLKETVPESKELLENMTNLYRLNDVLQVMAPKLQKEFEQRNLMNMTKEQTANLARRVVITLGLAGSAIAGSQYVPNKTAAGVMRGAGIIAGASQIPVIKESLAGGPAMELYSQLGKEVLSPKQQVIKNIPGAGGRTIIQDLFRLK